MLRKSVMLTCVLVLGFAAASEAGPLDSPGMVYIDGLPCNRLCLSYMRWSHELSSTRARRSAQAVAQRGAAIREERSKPAAQAGVAQAKPAAPNSNQVPRTKIAGLRPAGHAAAKPVASRSNRAPQAKIAGSQPAANAAAAQAPEAKRVAPKSNEMPQAKVADLQPAANAAADSDNTATGIADPHPDAVSTAGSNATTIQAQVTAATAAAKQVTATAVAAPEQQASNADASDHPETALPADARKAAAASANDTDVRVVLVMTRPEIRSVSDLASKTIAIDDAQSASNGNVRAAIVAAGAAEVRLSDGQTTAIDRLIRGAVPAAVLALVSPEAALRFPGIEGFKIFQVLLLPRSLKAAADTPEAK
jgi:hypothetical protein